MRIIYIIIHLLFFEGSPCGGGVLLAAVGHGIVGALDGRLPLLRGGLHPRSPAGQVLVLLIRLLLVGRLHDINNNNLLIEQPQGKRCFFSFFFLP